MVADTELPTNAATLAVNVKPWAGALTPEPFNTSDSQLAAEPSFRPRTIYPFMYPDGAGGRETAWFLFRDDVDTARGPVRGNNLAGSVGERTYLTGNYANLANYVHGARHPGFTYRSAALPVADGAPAAVYEIGIPAPPLAPAAESQGTPTNDEAEREARGYVMTYVRILDGIEEEGPPSATSNIVSGVDTNPDPTADHYVAVTGLTVSTEVGVTRKRLYRTLTVGTRSLLHFLADIPNAQDSYDDITPNVGLGEVLATEGWVEPPAAGRGICFTANGIGAMFFNNVLCLCLPYIPHAWPVEFRRFTDDDIIAIAPTDNSVVVATRTACYIATGNHPASMTFRRLDIQQGCVSKRSMRTVGSHGVVYASGEGLVAISAGGAYRQITQGLYRRAEWQALGPANLHGVVYDSRYFYTTFTGAADPAKTRLCWIDPQRPDLGIVGVGVEAFALWQEEESGSLYAYHVAADGTYRLSELTALQVTPAPGQWRSRMFQLAVNEPPSFLRIGQADADTVTVQVDTDTTPGLYNRIVTGPKAVRLPRPKTLRRLQVTLRDITTPITSVTLTESLSEMADFPA